MNRLKPGEDAIFIVLNSLSNLTKERIESLAKMAQEKNAWVELYFDNDLSGKEAVRKVAAVVPRILDKSQEYSQFKDLNEALIKTPKEEISPTKSRGLRM